MQMDDGMARLLHRSSKSPGRAPPTRYHAGLTFCMRDRR
ncbi:hypothetical protein RSPO_c02956 [Ralstonia solanacearum Po82]|uniref:Uncharacterized protein n=1 Tax=Ralstonia solanacearum (strain Po82) TaxID=1031711 RepID=F6G5E7_RALS8|nr:hypothetical protein RSPO_c02956 [Ralstonia solanacearum Po82]